MVIVDLAKAKNIAHDIRRQKRSAEFEPLDSVLAKQIPGTDVQQVETARQQIREHYAQVQLNIDAAENIEQLTQVVHNI